MKIKVILDLGPPCQEVYQTDTVKKIIFNNPDLNIIITHLGFPPIGYKNTSDEFKQWKEQIILGKNQNIFFDIAGTTGFFWFLIIFNITLLLYL